MASGTRSQDKVYLVGLTSAVLSETGEGRLPTLRKTLSKLFHHTRKDGKTIQEAASLTIDAVLERWQKARACPVAKKNAITKLRGFHSEWDNLMKRKSRNTDENRAKKAAFEKQMDKLFDISRKDALSLIDNEEDREFSVSQREDTKKGYMGKVDKDLAEKEKRKEQRPETDLKRKQKADVERANFDRKIAHGSVEEFSDEESQEASSSDVPAASERGSVSVQDVEEPTSKVGGASTEGGSRRGLKSLKKKFLTPGLTSALDRACVSDRNATMILAATLQAVDLNIEEYVLNRSAVRQARIENRSLTVQSLRQSYSPPPVLTLHWDGKLLRDLSGVEHVDRLPVVVTAGEESYQLLGVPKLESGTGINQATAVANLVFEWDLLDHVSALNFDTTSSNTGPVAGACVKLEILLEKEFLHLPCRLHILELSLGAVFFGSMGPSSGPVVPLFKRFQEFWEKIKWENVTTLKDDVTVWNSVKETAKEIAEFARDQLAKYHPRDDYRELLELVLIIICEKSIEDYIFKLPGSYSLARWMAKAIYCLKIYLFQRQFKLSKRDQKGVLDVCLFVILVYSKTSLSGHLPIADTSH